MGCWRFHLRRKFVPYLEGGLPPDDVKRLEQHLLDCQGCRAAFVRLRAGHQWAQQLRHLRLEADQPPAFEAVMAGEGSNQRAPRWGIWLDAVATPKVVEVLALLVLVLSALLVASNRRLLFGQRSIATVKAGALDLSDFHRLSIPELQSNTQPHIATEGYVRDVHADQDEGTVQFKLVENPQGAAPFVVCEIMSPIQMAVPPEGTHIRVYGVARYDAQTERKWNEVNPVLNIAILKR
jgi:hypothetical protein